jgi:hypothetical protein
VLEQGRVLEHRALAGVAARDGARRFELILAEPRGDLAGVLAAAGAVDVGIEGATAHFVATGGAAAQAALLRRLIEAGLPVASFAAARSDLQDAYLTLLKDSRARPQGPALANGTQIQGRAAAGPRA